MYYDRFRCLTTLSGDTIVKYVDYYFEIVFLDIDGDGCKDIRVFVVSNTPNQCDNYFFDKDTKKYRYIKGCDLDITLIKGTKLFYSYNHTGCADMDWESHLCKIENWGEVDIGCIEANGCGDENDGIKIYKLNGEKQDLIKKMALPQFNKWADGKWGFIKQYWYKNYKLFN